MPTDSGHEQTLEGPLNVETKTGIVLCIVAACKREVALRTAVGGVL